MKSGDLIRQIKIDHFFDLSKQEQANRINSALLEPLEAYSLNEPLARFPVEDEPELLNVTVERELKMLSKLHLRKASKPRQCAQLASKRVLGYLGSTDYTNPQHVF